MPKGSDEDTLARRRAKTSILLLETDRLADETAAFDVIVNLVYAGHWAETKTGRAAVTWVGGELIETELCGGDKRRVKAAIRPTIPTVRLRPEEAPTPPKSDSLFQRVRRALLCEAVVSHPVILTVDQLVERTVVANRHNDGEKILARQAIRDLRQRGLLQDGAGKAVEPTQAALHAHALLAAHD